MRQAVSQNCDGSASHPAPTLPILADSERWSSESLQRQTKQQNAAKLHRNIACQLLDLNYGR
jgi:hypothetical protein